MGYSVEESLDTPFEAYLRPEDREEAREAFQRHLTGKTTEDDVDAEGRFTAEGYLVTADGNLRWIHLSAQQVTDEAGRVVGTTGTITDLTGSKRAEAERKARERAEELLAAKTSLLSNMDHELRTPLTSILGYAEVLEEETEEEHRVFAERIAENGRRLRDTLESVLQLAHLDAREATELHLQPVSVGDAAQRAASTYRSAAEAKGLAFDVEVPARGLPLTAGSNTTGSNTTGETNPTQAMLSKEALARILDKMNPTTLLVNRSKSRQSRRHL